MRLGVLFLFALVSRAQSAPPDLGGVYQAIPSGATLAGGLKNVGSPSDIALLPVAVQQMKTVNLKDDPVKMCQPVGPFRMMARERTKIELVPARGMMVMLFEDISLGVMRTVYLNRGHREKVEPNWLGDSVGHWEGDTLVVDVTGFNDKTWLVGTGTFHTDALHVTERYTRVDKDQINYDITMEDPNVLTKPWIMHTNLMLREGTRLQEYVCAENNLAPAFYERMEKNGVNFRRP